MAGRVTVKDVARACGVSASVVSCAVNGASRCKSRFSEQTLQRVRQAAKDMGYTRLASASTLRTSRTFTIAVLGGFHPQTGWFYPSCNMDILAGINRALAGDARYGLLLDLERKRSERANTLREGRVDGALVLEHLDPALREALHETGVPYVTINIRPNGVDAVYPDDMAPLRGVLERWKGQGVRRVTYLQDGALSRHFSMRQRKSVTLALGKELGLQAQVHLYSHEDHPADLLRALKWDAGHGLVCYGESTAQTLVQLRLLAGEGAGRVVCWARQSLEALLLPWIARIPIPFELLGLTAAEMLLRRLNGGTEHEPGRLVPCRQTGEYCEPSDIAWGRFHHEIAPEDMV